MKFGSQKWQKAFSFAKALVTFNRPKKERSRPEETGHIGHDHNPTPSLPIDYFALEQHWPFPVVDTPSFLQPTRDYVALSEVELVSHSPAYQNKLDYTALAQLTDLNGQLPNEVPDLKDSVLLPGVEALPPQQTGSFQLLQEPDLCNIDDDLFHYPVNPEQDLASQLGNRLFHRIEAPFDRLPPEPQEVSPAYAVQDSQQAAFPQICEQQTLQFPGGQFSTAGEAPKTAENRLYIDSATLQASAGDFALVTESPTITLSHEFPNEFDKMFSEIDRMEVSVAPSAPAEVVVHPTYLSIPTEQSQHRRSVSFSSTISGQSSTHTAPTVSTFTGEIPCPHCDRCFSHRYQVNRHVRVHTLPIPCPVHGCGRRFAQKPLLKRHLVEAHREIAKDHGAHNIYWCPVPNCIRAFGRGMEGFARRETLKKHCEALSHPPLSRGHWRMVLGK